MPKNKTTVFYCMGGEKTVVLFFGLIGADFYKTENKNVIDHSRQKTVILFFGMVGADVYKTKRHDYPHFFVALVVMR